MTVKVVCSVVGVILAVDTLAGDARAEPALAPARLREVALEGAKRLASSIHAPGPSSPSDEETKKILRTMAEACTTGERDSNGKLMVDQNCMTELYNQALTELNLLKTGPAS